MSDDNKPQATKVILGAEEGKLVRLAGVHLHKPRMNTDSGKEEYKTMAMIPFANAADLKAVRAAIEEQKKAYLAETKKKEIPKDFWDPLKNADTDTRTDGEPWSEEFHGHYIVRAKSMAHDDEGAPRDPPEVVGTMRDEKNKLTPLGAGDIKSGDWGRVSINFKFFTKKAGGVSAWLNRVQKVRAGDPMSNRGSAEDDFGSYDDDMDEDDPLLK
jgi:hypothetical protein